MKHVNQMIRNGWTNYPQSRPLKGKAVEVATFDLDSAILFLGKGVGSERRSCGGCISINGTTIDSSRSVLWRYVDRDNNQ